MSQGRKRQIQVFNKAAVIRLTILSIVLLLILGWIWFTMLRMPGVSYSRQLPPLTAEQSLLQEALQRDIEKLGGDIGPRNSDYYDNLKAAAQYLESSLEQAGYTVQQQQYSVGRQTFANLEIEIPGVEHPDEIVIVGAHYDSVFSSRGANDNGSGAAAVVELARRFANKKTSRTLRFVEFVNEEPPFFWTENMGSLVYAKRCRERNENIVAMLSLETMGYYSDEKGSQKYPAPLNLVYPSVGNFIGFVGNVNSGALVTQVIAAFRRQTQFPSEGAALPAQIPGVGWSDHWAFWQQGYPGVMVTDTAPFRYPHYHTIDDTPDKIDYARLARVVLGLERVIAELAG
ncbi:MAG: M28 family peptidase [Nostocaceae cyanobacterium]|nr:M28 family peptidase [Nostocaceae cyanobacterium]